jgi:hypothetical protein
MLKRFASTSHPSPNHRVRKNDRRLLLLVILVCVFSALGVITHAQFHPCASSSFTDWKTFKTPDAQGLLHVSVSYNGNATMIRLMKDAIAAWNIYKCWTGVVFAEPPAGSEDLAFTYTTDETLTGSCAAYVPAHVTIYHGPNLQNRLNQLGEEQTRAVFKHEVGHFLGLDEDNISPATIMTQGASCLSTAAVTTVTLTDALSAGSCLGHQNTCPTPTPTPQPTNSVDCSSAGWSWNFIGSATGNIGGYGCFPSIPEECQADGYIWSIANTNCTSSTTTANGCQSGLASACTRHGGDFDFETCTCSGTSGDSNSPILIDVSGNGFSLTDPQGGVNFDVNDDTVAEKIAWTAVGSDDA